MFKLHIDLQQSSMDWHVENNALISRCGEFIPFSHPMVGVRAVLVSPGHLGIFIFEQPYDEDFTGIRLVSAAGVFIQSSRLSTVPVFFTDNEKILDVSWDPLELYPLIEPVLHEQRALLYLSHFEQPYGFDTVLAQIKQLCAGHGVVWQQNHGWDIYQHPLRVTPYPKVLKKRADPCQSFGQLLDSTLQRLLPDPSVTLASGFSGGLDSSIVTVTAARAGYKVNTYGLLMPDEGRISQQQRRTAVIEKYGIVDHTVDTAENRPSGAAYGHTARQPMVPWEELHYACFDEIYQRAAEEGCRVFLTGFGGDELLCEYWDEMEDKASALLEYTEEQKLPDFLSKKIHQNQRDRLDKLMVTPAIYAQSSVVEAISGVAAQCLRNGLWPVHLLTTPEVVQYCHSLPHEWRAERTLMRKVLSGWGVDDLIAYPQTTENFTTLSCQTLTSCQQAMAQFPLEKLGAMGWVETREVAHAFQRWLDGVGKGKMDIHFIAAVVLESTLDSVVQARARENVS
ncbi:hypothetical protein CWS43_15345 [Rahnella sp. AA]|uniref:asparagine synthase-related protein n=1 Tax=Rahnella sp. AA TaxID=2057180 RepID=UPI000C33777B|nr:asparagine synthase-related protein [Rahnella sp. AA]PKE29431.1 hypothetical protein CWS43_15345 [Rahnella sp. AA]